MASSPRSVSPWPGSESAPAPSKNANFAETESAWRDDVLMALRAQVISGQQAQDVLLGAITTAAQAVTDAGGAALALRQQGAVICLASSGDIAPKLGMPVSEQTGLSGQCLRAGQTLRCNDTEEDVRVDAEACRALGVRSLAVVPIRSNSETIGLLEILSRLPHAFKDEHIAFLSSLAGLVETMDLPVERAVGPAPQASTGPQFVDASLPVEPRETSAFWQEQPSWWKTPQARYGAVVIAAVLMLAVSFVGWRLWRGNGQQSSASNRVALDKPVANDVIRETADVTLKPDAEVSNAKESVKPPLVQAAKKEVDDGPVVIRRFDAVVTAMPPAASGAVDDASAPPPLSIEGGDRAVLQGVLRSSATMPSLGIPVSQGATLPVLERKIMPRYPAQALATRLAGTVVLRARVDESGRVDDVQVVSGPPSLGVAAMEAVKQWRYRPATLNSKPVPTETSITITFDPYGKR